MNILKLIFICFIFSINANVFSQENGILKGKIIDEETENPIPDALIELLNFNKKISTNDNGEFLFDNLKYDTYQIKISAIGYNPIIKSDLVVYASKPLEVIIKLDPKGISTETIDVEANYFEKSSDVNISSINLDFEEIRRAPGASEDISRMLQTIPGVSFGYDQRNDIIVRGGSPSENLLLIDGIEIPNINHFGSQGTTSGAIGFINSKFIQDVDMLTGGFPSLYGDKLSGVVNIKFREGSKKDYYNDINLSMAGFGGMFEGPLTNKGSYLFSVRRSYLELLKSSLKTTSVPNYWDFNLKLNYDLSPNDRISLISLLGLDKITFSSGVENDNPYGKSEADQKTFGVGINYKKLFSKGYLETVLSNSHSDHNLIQFDHEDNIRFRSDSYENEIILKSELNHQLSRSMTLNIGVGGKFALVNVNMFLKSDTTYEGYIYNEINTNTKINTYKYFSHINLTNKFFSDRVILNLGLRYDYFDYIKLKNTISPRAGLSFKITPVTSLNFAYGIYYQTPAYLWISSHPSNNNLNSIRSDHYIFGVEHFFSSNIKASIELYEKKYKDYPVWKDIPTYILIDGGSDFGPNLVGEAVSAGRGYVRGIDISIQKKLSKEGLYGIINYSYTKTGFTAIEGGEKPGAFDPGHQLTFIAGYQFKTDWLVGFKFKYSGGRPFTPLDEEKSKELGTGIYSTNDFNSSRYPYYLRIDLRIDKKINFKKASLVGYLELQNIFNRANIYSYFWNEEKNEKGTIYQWAFFPVGGVSIQF